MSGFGIKYYPDGRYGITNNDVEIYVFNLGEVEEPALREFVGALNDATTSRIIRDWNGTDAPYWIG